MEKIKKYLLPVTVTILLLLLILVRNTGTGRFRYDADKLARKAYDRSNIVTPGNYGNFSKEAMFVLLDENMAGTDLLPQGARSLRIPADSIMDSRYASVIRKNGNPVILFSNDEAVSSRVWMVLAQTGFSNIYIWSASAVYDSTQK